MIAWPRESSTADLPPRKCAWNSFAVEFRKQKSRLAEAIILATRSKTSCSPRADTRPAIFPRNRRAL